MDELETLRAELEHYRRERDKLRDLMGQIGGQSGARRHMVVNGVFLVVVVGFFAFDLVRHYTGWNPGGLPPLVLLEVAVLLVSVKIIWMIHVQTRVNHFQFWILNSIEFRLNNLSRRLDHLDGHVRAASNGAAGRTDTGDTDD